jgi:hypothetical protein
VDILNYKQINKGCLIGRFDVKIPEWGILLRGCSYFKKEGKEWLGMPCSRLEGKDGRPVSYDHVILDKPIRARFDAACLEKIRKGEIEEKKEPVCNTPF